MKIFNHIQTTNRIIILDILRAIAIVCMIIFHFTFNLDYFAFIDIDIVNNIYWKAFRVLIVSMFLFSFGYALQLTHTSFSFTKIFKKILVLFLMASTITLSTYFIFSSSWIYFGILHFILFAYIISLFFLRFSSITLIALAITLHTLYLLDILHTTFIYEYIKDFLHLPLRTEDLVRFFPWFSMVLIGIALGKLKLLEKINIKKAPRFILFLGQNSLIIYIIHQPILFSFLYLLK